MMDVRKLKLSIVCGGETEEIKAINNFFDNLFNNLKIYSYFSSTVFYFVKNDKLLLVYDTNDTYLHVDNDTFWKALNIDTSNVIYHPYNNILPFDNICGIFKYKFIEKYDDALQIIPNLKVGILTVIDNRNIALILYKRGVLINI